ncbi:MAG: sigma-70 family RNA polymerase sigma factor [Clostridiales bacterium]|nr:sigma-70 family RNA polymerase sigma factor [Clostridiales bacterium]
MNDELLTPMLEHYTASRSKELRDRLFETLLPMAKAVARRFVGRGVEIEDLEQVAAMALLKALERFEPDRGYRFITYAIPTITGDVRNYLRDKGSAMRMPRDARQKLFHMQQERDRFSQEHLREPTAKELAQAMQMSPDDLLMLLQLRDQNDIASLDSPLSDENGALADLLGGEENGFARVEDDEWMQWVLSKVNDAERKLLLLRYREQLGQRETAKRMGVSQMQVSRMERRILSRLRAIEQSGA